MISGVPTPMWLLQDPELCTLTNQKVSWTRRDLLEFGKSQFRTWRSTYQKNTHQDKKVLRETRDRVNKRNQRRIHVCIFVC